MEVRNDIIHDFFTIHNNYPCEYIWQVWGPWVKNLMRVLVCWSVLSDVNLSSEFRDFTRTSPHGIEWNGSHHVWWRKVRHNTQYIITIINMKYKMRKKNYYIFFPARLDTSCYWVRVIRYYLCCMNIFQQLETTKQSSGVVFQKTRNIPKCVEV